MITLDEIRNVAARVALATTVVEKDYALGWLLWGIHNHPQISRDWVFKGGTCLKKCYFETYRFSEDLDFSFIGPRAPDVDSLIKIFSEISDSVLQESGLEFIKSSIQFESFQNPRGSLSIEGGVKYRSIVRPKVGVHNMQRIKIDLTLDEPVVLPPVARIVDHPYSDRPSDGISILSYVYEEVFAEKVRALGQRLRPRDLYDVIHLHRRMDLEPDQKTVLSTLEKKCRLRGIGIPTLQTIQTHENSLALAAEWENQLKHQIQVLPDFQSFLGDLGAALDWIHGALTEELETYAEEESSEEDEEIKLEPVKGLTAPGPHTSMMDKIRFAAANRFVVRLGYQNSFREIECYAFARSSDDNLLLRAVRLSPREPHSYRWDRIQSVEVLEKTFQPQYQVEITSSGFLPIHQLTRKGMTRRSGRAHGPVHLYACPFCTKKFRVKSQISTLNPHKDKNGMPCRGRFGTYLGRMP